MRIRNLLHKTAILCGILAPLLCAFILYLWLHNSTPSPASYGGLSFLSPSVNSTIHRLRVGIGDFLDSVTSSSAGMPSMHDKPLDNSRTSQPDDATALKPDEPDSAAQTNTTDRTKNLPHDQGMALLEPGLEYGEFVTDGGSKHITAVRINPENFDLLLCSSLREDSQPRTLGEWGEKFNLSAAINASMYLPDGLKSTGYMRSGTYINNGRIVGRFGAFLTAGPDTPNLPRTAIIEKDDPDWKEKISHYRMVVQNYRMINSQRRILWSPGGPLYSISAIAQDGKGRILFLHSRDRIEAYVFAQQLLQLPLDIHTVMYVEGGSQAGLLIHSEALSREVQGRSAAYFITGRLRVRLPNVIGARRHITIPSPGPEEGAPVQAKGLQKNDPNPVPEIEELFLPPDNDLTSY